MRRSTPRASAHPTPPCRRPAPRRCFRAATAGGRRPERLLTWRGVSEGEPDADVSSRLGSSLAAAATASAEGRLGGCRVALRRCRDPEEGQHETAPRRRRWRHQQAGRRGRRSSSEHQRACTRLTCSLGGSIGLGPCAAQGRSGADAAVAFTTTRAASPLLAPAPAPLRSTGPFAGPAGRAASPPPAAAVRVQRRPARAALLGDQQVEAGVVEAGIWLGRRRRGRRQLGGIWRFPSYWRERTSAGR